MQMGHMLTWRFRCNQDVMEIWHNDTLMFEDSVNCLLEKFRAMPSPNVLSRIRAVPMVWQMCTGTNSVHQELAAKRRTSVLGLRAKCYHLIVQRVLLGQRCDIGTVSLPHLSFSDPSRFTLFHPSFYNDKGVDPVSRFCHSLDNAIFSCSFKLSLHTLLKVIKISDTDYVKL